MKFATAFAAILWSPLIRAHTAGKDAKAKETSHHRHHHHDHGHAHHQHPHQLRALRDSGGLHEDGPPGNGPGKGNGPGTGNGKNPFAGLDFCATRKPDKEDKKRADAAMEKWNNRPDHAGPPNKLRRLQDDVIVPTYIHIIIPNDLNGLNQVAGNEQAQLDVLNAAFVGYKFELVSITTTTSAEYWNVGHDTTANSMKSELRQGGKDALNIYFTLLSGGLLGWATFPWAGNLAIDGVVCHHGTGIGGTLSPYNLGDTLTHEVGHWLGLFHTFQGGCTGSGDDVSDTNKESTPTYGCPTGQTSCDGSIDPIYNFMDYTDDSCMNTFTDGQRDRMNAMWYEHRSTGPTPPSATSPAPSPATTTTTSATATTSAGVNCLAREKQNLKVEVSPDDYGSETSWSLTNLCTNQVEASKEEGSYDNDSYVLEVFERCVPYAKYEFTINDSWGDGMCCGHGVGSYEVTYGTDVVKQGGEFESTETTKFGSCLVVAEYNTSLGAPHCANVGFSCTSGPDLLKGKRTNLEPNNDNTIDGCADGAAGSYGSDESIDRITISAVNGDQLQAGQLAKIEAYVHPYKDGSLDRADFYITDNPGLPNWSHIGQLAPTGSGFQNLVFPEFVLLPGSVQVLRVIFHYGGNIQNFCGAGIFDDTDDLIFEVAPASSEQAPSPPMKVTTPKPIDASNCALLQDKNRCYEAGDLCEYEPEQGCIPKESQLERRN